MTIAAALGASTGASAQASSSRAPANEVRASFARGMEAYNEGRFEEALREFQRSYTLSGEPDILYNIALVYDRLRRDEEALEAYRSYLRSHPESGDRENIESRIEVLEREMEERRVSAERLEEERAAAVQAREEAEARAAAGEREGQHQPPPAPPVREDPTAAWVLAGAGGAVMVAGVALLIATQLDIVAVQNGTRWSEVEEAYNRVPILGTTGWVLAGVGLGAFAAGLGWGLTIQMENDVVEAELRLRPTGFDLRGRF